MTEMDELADERLRALVEKLPELRERLEAIPEDDPNIELFADTFEFLADVSDLLLRPSLPAGHVAVPVEPTEEMKSSGMDVLMHRGDIYARDDGTVVIETITPADLWAAMLAALPHNQGEGK